MAPMTGSASSAAMRASCAVFRSARFSSASRSIPPALSRWCANARRRSWMRWASASLRRASSACAASASDSAASTFFCAAVRAFWAASFTDAWAWSAVWASLVSCSVVISEMGFVVMVRVLLGRSVVVLGAGVDGD